MILNNIAHFNESIIGDRLPTINRRSYIMCKIGGILTKLDARKMLMSNDKQKRDRCLLHSVVNTE